MIAEIDASIAIESSTFKTENDEIEWKIGVFKTEAKTKPDKALTDQIRFVVDF